MNRQLDPSGATEITRHLPMQRRQLIPVKTSKDAVWAVDYVRRQISRGGVVSACLLHIDEDPPPWRTHAGKLATHNQRSYRRLDIFAEAMSMLDGTDIEIAAYLRSGPVVFSILDAAEELDCNEIIVPAPQTGLLRLLSRDIVTMLIAKQRAVPVVTVDRRGIATT